MTLFKKYIFILLISLLGRSAYAEEQHQVDRRVTKNQRDSQELFQSLPSGHIVPIDRNALFHLVFTKIDKSAELVQLDGPKQTHEKLALSYASVSPMIAFTNKWSGLGLSAEMGEGTSRYEDLLTNQREKGNMRHSGLGLLWFHKPIAPTHYYYLSNSFRVRALNVSQRVQSDSLTTESKRFDYGAFGSNAGLDLGLCPLTQVCLVPWSNISYLYVPKVSEANRSSDFSARLAADQEHLLSSGFELDWGIDIAFRFDYFDIHCGNLINSVLSNKNGSTEHLTLKDRSYTIGLGFQTSTRRGIE